MSAATMNAPARRVDPVNELGNDFGNGGNGREAMVEVATARAAQEVQAAMMIAKRFPRSEIRAREKILESCKRKALAEQSVYSYPRGSETVDGPTIRLAEVLARAWGNIDFGIVELEQRNGESSVMAYAWDLETNARQTKIFTVRHERTKNDRRSGQKIKTVLDDPRDIYEMTANQGARRLRACILGIIPGDIVDEAVEECERTMAGNNGEPLPDRIRMMATMFSAIGVSKEMIENRIGHLIDITSEVELVQLKKILVSLKNRMASIEDFFYTPGTPGSQATQKTADLNDALRQPAKQTAAPTPSQPTPQEQSADLQNHDFARPGTETPGPTESDVAGVGAQPPAPEAPFKDPSAMNDNEKWWASLRDLAAGIPENNLIDGVAHWRKANNLMPLKEHLAKPKNQKELFEAIEKREGAYFSVAQ